MGSESVYAPKDGQLKSMTYGNGDTVSYTCDTLGRRTSMTTADGNKYLYTYTGDGQLYEITDTDAEVVYRYQYDSIGRLIGSEELRKQTGDDGTPAAATMRLQTWHQYDSNDRLTVQSWKYLDKAYTERYNYVTVAKNAFWGSVYPGTIKRGIKCLSITCY
ncbi:MAG: RHS repeat domain-containing protein [Fusicatenibacter sp.]